MRAFLVSACIAATTIGAAQAQPTEIRIPVSSTDLQSDANLAVLVSKIEAGAKTLCSHDDSVPLSLSTKRDCEKAAVRAAIDDSKLQPLENYYLDTHGLTPAKVEPSTTLALR